MDGAADASESEVDAEAEPDAGAEVVEPDSPDAGEACPPGRAGCRCDEGEACGKGLRCSAGRCAPCPEGSDGCACTNAQACNYGLVCVEGSCVSESCVPGAEACPCADGVCDEGLGCGADDLCRTCRADIAGCPCIGDSCSLDLLCDLASGACRKPVSCAELVDDGTCVEHQACIATPGEDARCVPRACEAGFLWDDASASCVPCVGCVTGPSCLVGTSGVADECATAYRSCTEADGLARCGGCAEGAELVNGACLPVNRCGSEVCSASQYCDRLLEQCLTLPCPVGQAKSAETNGACSTCTNACGGVGFTGRFWPFRTKTGRCVCETFPGFYGEASGLRAERCDADGDGWVRQEADDGAIREDEALLQNARCEILRVERVVLRDEYGGQKTLASCREEGFVDPDSGASCGVSFPLRLLENQLNDTAGAATARTTPRYPDEAGARRLTGPELNAMTKACVSELADFDGDGSEDLYQTQDVDIRGSTADRERLRAFAYFVELYHARYAPPATGQTLGSLVIEERSRCDEDSFPFHYSDDDGYGQTGGVNRGYWRSCARFRDPSFDGADPQPGDDFSRFTCSSSVGSCGEALPGPAHPDLDYRTVDPRRTLMRNAGLCELGGRAPRESAFRGLGHSSQFRCVRVTDFPRLQSELSPDEFGAGAEWTFNACRARTCTSSTGCSERAAVGAGGGYEPLFDCKDKVPQRNAVGFALRNYTPYGTGRVYTTRDPPAPRTYQGGCVNEDSEWGQKFCPEPEFVRGYEVQSFGRYSCFGDKSRFMWATAADQVQRGTLYWASSASSLPPNGSAWCVVE